MNPAGATRRAGVLPWRGLWRQSLTDSAPLAVGLALAAAAAFLTGSVPPTMVAVAASELQAALAGRDEPVNVVVTVPFTDSPYQLNLDLAAAAASLSDQVDAGIPADLREVLAPPVTLLEGPELKAGAIAGRPGRVRFLYVAGPSGPVLEWTEGRAPGSLSDPGNPPPDDGTPLPLEVAVSEAGARLLGVRAGARLAVDSPSGQPLDVRLSGIYRAADPADAAWAAAPLLLRPQVVDGSAAIASVGLLTSAESLPFARVAVAPTGMTRAYTYGVIPSPLDPERAASIATQARGLASGRQVFDIAGADVRVRTQLDRVIDDSLQRVAAATAQASVVLIGLLSGAGLAMLLVASLVVSRRSGMLTQWRSRGATLPAIGLANLAESALLTVVAGAVGLGAAGLVVGGATPWAWVLPPLVLALLPQPVLAMRAAASASSLARSTTARSGGRSPARVRRLAAEAMLALTAAASLATLVLRGVPASAGALWSDAVVLAAPVLVALSVAAALVRFQPLMLGVARRSAARKPGAVPLLAVTRTRANGLATAALVTAAALAAVAACTATTIAEGQDDAAWAAIGADAAARTSAPAGLPSTVAGLDGTGGLIAATAASIPGAQVIGSGLDEVVTIVAVDADALVRLAAATPLPDTPELTALPVRASGTGDTVPVLTTIGQDWASARLRWGETSVAVHPAGVAPALPALAVDGPVILVDRATLAAAVGQELPATRALVAGPEADARLTTTLAGSEATVTSRERWLADRAADPLTRALGELFNAGSAVAIMLAALAVALLGASGSSERTIATARVKVLGLSRSAAARIAWVETTVPAVVASAVGLLVGTVLAALLGQALDLVSVTGGMQAPRLAVPWWIVTVPAGLGIVARIGVAVESFAHRDQQLGPLLRSG